MQLALDLLINAALLALLAAKLCAETWVAFPYYAPVRFFPHDLLAAALCGLLVARLAAFPAAPILLLHRIRRAVLLPAGDRAGARRTGALFAGFFGIFLVVHLMRHWSMNTELYDHTLVAQALYRAWDGHLLRSDTMVNATFLSAHLAYSLLLLAPLTTLLRSDELVFLLQALLVAVPLWFAFAAGPLRGLRRCWPAAFAIVACSAALRNGLVWDFREDGLAFALLLAALLCLLRRRLAAYGLFLALALLAKENVCFLTPFLALPILLEPDLPLARAERAWLAAGTVAASVLWAALAFTVLIPHYSASGAAPHDLVRYFPSLGAKPGEVVGSLLAAPAAALALARQRLLTTEAATYGIFLFLPYAFFLRRGGWWIAPAIPGALMNALAERPYLRFLAFHYDWVLLPFLIVALLKGIERTAAGGREIPARSWALALALALAFSGTWPLLHFAERYRPSAASVRDVLYLRRLPREGALAVARGLAIAQLADVREIRMFNDVPYQLAADRERAWGDFWERNATDATLIPGHGARAASRMLLDLRDPVQAFLAAEAPRHGWRAASLSPSGTFAYYLRG
jgi:uncharacterized membrane protein